MNTEPNLDPELLHHLGVIGAAKIARSGLDFAGFSAAMTAEFGDKIKSSMQEIWDRSNSHLEQELKKVSEAINKALDEEPPSSPAATLGNPAETSEPFVATPRPLSPLDEKILLHFPGLVVRKDLTNGLKQNAVVPTYVLEYLLGQHCATDDTAVIKAGLESVQKILAKHYVHRNQAQLVKSTIKEKGRHKVIDKLTVELNDKGGFYEAEFTNLGLKKVPVSDDFVRRFPKLLVR